MSSSGFSHFEMVNATKSTSVESPYGLLLRAAILIPVSHYLVGILVLVIVYVYNLLEMHFFRDLFAGFTGQPVTFTFNPSSQVYRDVVSKCRILHGRYLSTPWLCSPHLQTAFLHYVGNAPVVNYKRQLFTTSDGGTLALDWVTNAKVMETATQDNGSVSPDDRNPIIIVVPGLTSASDAAYIKHLVFEMANCGWNVVVSNHRGLAGVPLTSDRVYDAGWSEDIHEVIMHLHRQYPEAPLYAVGTSIGANVLVRYLGKDGINVPLIGAAAVCCPWDLLIGDRFINRKFIQSFYNKALGGGLKGYAHMHEDYFSRASNWEGVKKARFLREYDNSASRVFGNYETVDAYYRQCSSSDSVTSVMVPLLCINSSDDPVCTKEAIPFDECRLNGNVVLATTEHGGHIPFFEGLNAKSLWWVRAVKEYIDVLQSSQPCLKKKEVQMPVSNANALESSINKAPCVLLLKDGTVATVHTEAECRHEENKDERNAEDLILAQGSDQEKLEAKSVLTAAHAPERCPGDKIAPAMKSSNQLLRLNGKSFWLLIYIAVVTSWPILGSAFSWFFRKRFVSRASGKR